MPPPLQIEIELNKNSAEHFAQDHNLPFPFCGISAVSSVPFRIISIVVCGNKSLIVVDFCFNLHSIIWQRCKFVFPRWLHTHNIMLVPYCCPLPTHNCVPQHIIVTKTIFNKYTYAIALPMMNKSKMWIRMVQNVLKYNHTVCLCLGIAKKCFVLSCSTSVPNDDTSETIDTLTQHS